MKAQPMRYFSDWLRGKLKDRKFRRGFDRVRAAVQLGYEIYRLRQRLGLTQAQLARRMGTKQQTVSRLEAGDYEGFTLRTLQKIARATKTELVIQFRRSAG